MNTLSVPAHHGLASEARLHGFGFSNPSSRMLEFYYLITPFYRLSCGRQNARPKDAFRINLLLLANG